MLCFFAMRGDLAFNTYSARSNEDANVDGCGWMWMDVMDVDGCGWCGWMWMDVDV